MHPEDREYAERQWREAVRDETQVDAEFRLQRADGSWRWTNVRAAPLRDPDGSVRKWVGMNIDITERKEAEEALRQLTETLEEQVQVRTEQLQELAVRLTRAEQAERHRISQVLHDDLQQWLYSVQLSLEMIRDAVRDERHDADVLLQRLDSAYEKVKEATRRTRQLSVELSPPILEGDGLTEAFGWLATQMHEQYELTVQIDAEGSFHVPDQDLRVLLFQSVRELLFNVVKHAGVSHATVQMRWEDGELRMQVSDEGAGFDTEAVMRETPSGWGLANVRERLELVGGRMEVASEPSEGTWITLCAPVERSSTTED